MEETRGGFMISQIKQIQGRIFERLLGEAGILEFNGAQGRILYVLWQEDNLPIVELSKRTSLAKTTLTSMLDRMETQGYIIRQPDELDRRQLLIVLTEKARGLRDDYNRVSGQMNAIFYRGFTGSEIKIFESTLKRVLINLIEREEQP